MNYRPEEIEIVKTVARLFAENRERIISKWLTSVMKEMRFSGEDVELEYFRRGFESLVDDFSGHLSKFELSRYYDANYESARTIAYNDISYSKFVEAFHLFEESYATILESNFSGHDLVKCLEIIDRLHHGTISRVSEAYFEINDTTVFALARLAELRDPETAYHLERTREYSELMAQTMDLGETFVRNIYKVGPLHDIGKVGIPDSILLKPGPLTSEEYEIMKKHPLIGSEVITSIIGGHRVSRGYLIMARDIVLYHHEKFDGTGYPYGLSGNAIPLSARIFSVTDAYDAIVSKRPYKEALPHEEALRRIRESSGSHFDPDVVKAFLSVHEKMDLINRKFKEENLKSRNEG